MADVMTGYYALNFIRKPEFMGFNGYNDGIKRTEFNPLAWPRNGEAGQNHASHRRVVETRDDEAWRWRSLFRQPTPRLFSNCSAIRSMALLR